MGTIELTVYFLQISMVLLLFVSQESTQDPALHLIVFYFSFSVTIPLSFVALTILRTSD